MWRRASHPPQTSKQFHQAELKVKETEEVYRFHHKTIAMSFLLSTNSMLTTRVLAEPQTVKEQPET